MPLKIIFTYESFLLQRLSSKSECYLKYLKSDKFCWYLVNKGQGFGAVFFFFPLQPIFLIQTFDFHISRSTWGKGLSVTAFLGSCQCLVQKKFSTHSSARFPFRGRYVLSPTHLWRAVGHTQYRTTAQSSCFRAKVLGYKPKPPALTLQQMTQPHGPSGSFVVDKRVVSRSP